MIKLLAYEPMIMARITAKALPVSRYLIYDRLNVTKPPKLLSLNSSLQPLSVVQMIENKGLALYYTILCFCTIVGAISCVRAIASIKYRGKVSMLDSHRLFTAATAIYCFYSMVLADRYSDGLRDVARHCMLGNFSMISIALLATLAAVDRAAGAIRRAPSRGSE